LYTLLSKVTLMVFHGDDNDDHDDIISSPTMFSLPYYDREARSKRKI
jgi:hypothetical protein